MLTVGFVPKLVAIAELGKPLCVHCNDPAFRVFSYENEINVGPFSIKHQGLPQVVM
jgi:hypothetical protein